MRHAALQGAGLQGALPMGGQQGFQPGIIGSQMNIHKWVRPVTTSVCRTSAELCRGHHCHLGLVPQRRASPG